ncbi:MAG TPA: LamG domain-containing protein [Pedobacter sp.]|uniref:LamG domain-containing protein n=1 Tax=Pedobacter sp. TaxID=1411316 RepID=UPI002BAE9E88|nr:LamG domain-containing protein [Pedobacter sp.]HMI03296.1 LamG domain-containing protein [Pedobacter sp.]
MKLRYLSIGFAGIIIGTTLLYSCTKNDNGDDFPPGDVPPTAGGFTASSQIAPTNLIAYWNFNADNLLDSVSNTVGTNSGMTFTAGLKGKALNGNPDAAKKAYATAVASPAVRAMTQYTISCWVNSPQNTGATGIFSLGDTKGFWANINMFFENGGTTTNAPFKTIFADNGATYDTGVPLVSNGFNNWVSYIATYDGAGTFKSYINGSQVGSNTVTGIGAIRFLNIGPVVFGALHFMTVPSSTTGSSGEGWAGYLPGKIDEVRIYNKALTSIEVSALSTLERQGR